MKHRAFIGFIMLEFLVLFIFFVSGRATVWSRQGEVQDKRDTVKRLMLTDFALWTEARYTRNPSQADLFSAFQDFPSSIDHFPAGSIIAPGQVRESLKTGIECRGPGKL